MAARHQFASTNCFRGGAQGGAWDGATEEGAKAAWGGARGTWVWDKAKSGASDGATEGGATGGARGTWSWGGAKIFWVWAGDFGVGLGFVFDLGLGLGFGFDLSLLLGLLNT